MQIYINKKLAAIKKGSSFEYVSENRLFTGSDAYTLNISFPLKDCPSNIEIFGNVNRADVALGKVVFDCEIVDKLFIKTGSVIVTEISGSEVKCQFMEGRSEANFDKTFDRTYIDELDLGEPDITDPNDLPPVLAWDPTQRNFRYVALPWVNNNSDSGLPHNFAKYDEETKTYRWADTEQNLTWQPYLTYIIEKICLAVNYTPDISKLSQNLQTRYMLICNTLPDVWDLPNFARALPHWTVEEFFAKLEKFLGGEFTIDHRNQKISFDFSKNILSSVGTVRVDKVLEEYTLTYDSDGSDCDYMESKNVKYKSNDSAAWKYYSCDWFVKSRQGNCLRYETLNELLDDNRELALHWLKNQSFNKIKNTNLNKMMYAADVDSYFIVRGVDSKYITWMAGNGFLASDWVVVTLLQPINIFRPLERNTSSEEYEELEFTPVCIDYTEKEFGLCIFLDLGDYAEVREEYNEDTMEAFAIDTGTNTSLLAGSGDKSENGSYYDCIYIGYWDGRIPTPGLSPYPDTDGFIIKQDWSGWEKKPYSLRFKENSFGSPTGIDIDSNLKYTFKFLSDSIPDVRAEFLIRGKKYLCEKLTATFTEDGMSQLIKGEFYQIKD